jgi:hypothetical protein
MARSAGCRLTVDEVHGFRYFDNRDLFGLVDATEIPSGQAADEAELFGEEAPIFAGGAYVVIQKCLHDLNWWNALPIAARSSAKAICLAASFVRSRDPKFGYDRKRIARAILCEPKSHRCPPPARPVSEAGVVSVIRRSERGLASGGAA